MRTKFLKTESIIKDVTDELSFHDNLNDKIEFLSNVIDEIVTIRQDIALNFTNRKEKEINYRNSVPKNFITKKQIRSLYIFCREEGIFEDEELKLTCLDKQELQILEVLKDVQKQYKTIAEIVENTFKRINKIKE